MKKVFSLVNLIAGVSLASFLFFAACAIVVGLTSWAYSPDSTGVGIRSYVLQDVSDTIASNTTPGATELTTTVAANQRLHIRYYVPVSLSGTASGVKFLINAPASPTAFVESIALFTDSDSLALTRTVLTETALGVTLANVGDHYAIIDVTVTNGSTAGVIVLEVAQNVSDAGTVIVRKGAYAEVTKL